MPKEMVLRKYIELNKIASRLRESAVTIPSSITTALSFVTYIF